MSFSLILRKTWDNSHNMGIETHMSFQSIGCEPRSENWWQKQVGISQTEGWDFPQKKGNCMTQRSVRDAERNCGYVRAGQDETVSLQKLSCGGRKWKIIGKPRRAGLGFMKTSGRQRSAWQWERLGRGKRTLSYALSFTWVYCQALCADPLLCLLHLPSNSMRLSPPDLLPREAEEKIPFNRREHWLSRQRQAPMIPKSIL